MPAVSRLSSPCSLTPMSLISKRSALTLSFLPSPLSRMTFSLGHRLVDHLVSRAKSPAQDKAYSKVYSDSNVVGEDMLLLSSV